MNEPLISVIVPVYNVELYLDRCIRSIVEQTYRNLEIILVDDGSPDGCPAICDLWAERDDRIKVIHKENGGLSSARNSGLDICCGEYVAFVDSDDWIAPNMYETLLCACVAESAMLSVCGRFVISEGEKTVDKCSSASLVLNAVDFTARMLIGDRCDCSACDKLFHKELWDNIRFPIGRIYEDVAIMYQVVLKSSVVAIVDQPFYYYFRQQNSITKSAFSPRWFDYTHNTRNLLNDISENYPVLYEYACWTHSKALSNVLSKIAKAERKTYKAYLPELKALSKEVGMLKAVWKNSAVFSRYDKKLCMLYSVWYVIRPLHMLKSMLKDFGRNGK